MAKSKPKAPPIVVIYGDEEFQKSAALTKTLDSLLPPEVDRAMALTDLDGGKTEEQGGPTLAVVLDDLCTLPFLSDRRVVLVREADKFVTTARDGLERYCAQPSPTGALVLVCRSFPKTTRLYKAAKAAGGSFLECKKLSGRRLVEFVLEEVAGCGKTIDRGVAARLVDLIGDDQGGLAGEVEKLDLYTGERKRIEETDLRALVGSSREEKIFAVLDAAARGDLRSGLELWRQVLESDPAAAFRAIGGVAYVIRRWLAAHAMAADGMPISAIAPKVMMWGRDGELADLLRRHPPQQMQSLLAQIAELDAKAKVGARSIEEGISALLVRIASPAA